MSMIDHGHTFRKHFWEARNFLNSEELEEANQQFKEALIVAKEASLTIEARVAEAGLSAANGNTDDALTILKELTVSSTEPAVAFAYALIITLNVRTKAEESLAQCDLALNICDPIDRPHILRLRGYCKYELRDLQNAIDDYTAVINSNDTSEELKAITLINRGIAKGVAKDHKGAINDFSSAIDIDGAPSKQRARATYNRGVANLFARKIDIAIKDFHTSLGMPGASIELQARAYWGLGRAEKQPGHFAKAAALFRELGKEDQALHMESLHAAAKVPATERSESDNAELSAPTSLVEKEDTPESRMEIMISAAKQTQYGRYAKQNISDKQKLKNHLVILRGWSSTSPVLDPADGECLGGGYFLLWKNCGIVIDPGHDFRRNFHSEGYHARQIYSVIVSHNHGDHNQDLEPLDDLMYEMRKERPPGSKDYSYTLLCDPDTKGKAKFNSPATNDRCVVAFALDIQSQGAGKPIPIPITNPRYVPATVFPFKVQHSEDVPNAAGLRIELLDDGDQVACTLGYTSDTGYFDGLCDNNKLGGCDLLLAHISQPHKMELKDPTIRKKEHLGYRGLIELIQNAKPKVVIVGEFWAGLTDLRIELIEGLRLRTGRKEILPSSIGMRVELPSLDIWCSRCDKPTSASEIRVAPRGSSLGSLSYLCRRCSL